MRREIELLRNRCREYDAAVIEADEQVRFQQEQIDRLVDENAEQNAELVQLRALREQSSAAQSSNNQELDELQHNYRRVITDLHDAEEKARDLQRQLLAESQFREAVVSGTSDYCVRYESSQTDSTVPHDQKATFAANDQLPGQAAQEVMDQVAMLQRVHTFTHNCSLSTD